jgi:hypothetical protein
MVYNFTLNFSYFQEAVSENYQFTRLINPDSYVTITFFFNCLQGDNLLKIIESWLLVQGNTRHFHCKDQPVNGVYETVTLCSKNQMSPENKFCR